MAKFEFLFQAKRIDNGEVIEGSLIRLCNMISGYDYFILPFDENCGKLVKAQRSGLLTGNNKSCGCYVKYINGKRIAEYNRKVKTKRNKIEIIGDIAKIYFNSNDKYAIIDSEDVHIVENYCWCIANGYVSSSSWNNGKNQNIKLHHLILPNNDKTKEIDHIDRNTLNNRKNNLRIVSHMENMQNRGVASNSKTGIRNISLMKNGKYIVSFIRLRKKYYIGKYDTIEEAKQKLDEALKSIEENQNE